MKTRLWIAGLLALSLLSCLAVGGPRRAYWPTRGWRESEPSRQGLDPQLLGRMAQYIPAHLPRTSSLLVVRHGYIVHESYFAGGPATPRTLWSITKSVLSTLVGIALAEGRLRSLDQPMLDYFPEYSAGPLAPGVRGITLRHLLTMSDGISREGLDFLLGQDKLAGPLRQEPGSGFYYNSMSPQVLSIILTRSTGLTARDYAQQRLFGPLGIGEARWPEVQGHSLGAFGLELSSRDLAKIGYLYLNQGRWAGRQIVPPEWIAEATRPHIRAPRSQDFIDLTGPYFVDQYGFYWWIRPDQDPPAYLAQGYGGQFLYIIPGLDLVAVITAEDQDSRENLHALGYLALIDRFIVPAAR